ncbi:arginine--tRNA ligase, putative [Plasmodium ovale curtisi]|uniref:Arginine--tRNA ligase, putative n=1 Tax=Plasmodium ovale curtisi TaxID=864141 RepID=A0A1A8W285_PLAOA|nr:arginine--tRNA ligase, putative [Plasmodium ovale curtisi]
MMDDGQKREYAILKRCEDAAVGDAVVGDAAVGDAAVGDAAVGDAAVGDAVVGDAAVGDAAVGDAAVGDAAVGDAAVGDAAVGDAASEDVHTLLNNEITNVARKIVGDKNFLIPKHCLVENNKLFYNYHFQTSIIIFLENYIKGENNIRKNVIQYLEERYRNVVESLVLSPNGILNIQVKSEYIIGGFANFYHSFVKSGKSRHYRGDEEEEDKKTQLQKPFSKKPTVLLDYCGVNYAKHMHLGHLKSLFLGYAFSNIFRFCNFSVKSRNHVGNWNMNMAIIITFLILLSNHQKGCNLPMKWDRENEKVDEDKVNDKQTDTPTSIYFNDYESSTRHVSCDIKKESSIYFPVDEYLHMLSNLTVEGFYEKYKKLHYKHFVNLSLHTIDYMYKISKKLYSLSTSFQKFSKLILSLMYKNDAKVMALWDILRGSSKRENEEILRIFRIRRLVEKGERFYIKYVQKILQKMRDVNVLLHFRGKLCILLKKRETTSTQNGQYGDSSDDDSGSNPYRRGNSALSSKEKHYDVVDARDKMYQRASKGDIDFLKDNFSILTLKRGIAYTYAAIDIAAIYYRVYFEKANKIIYVVDENQKKHFMQVFSIAQFLSIFPEGTECLCVNYGFVLNEKNRKIKTKDISNNIFVKDIIKSYEQVHKNEKSKKGCNNFKNFYKPKYYQKVMLSSIIYSYVSVKNCKRQAIMDIIKDPNIEYMHIVNRYNEIFSTLRNLKKSDYFSLLNKRGKEMNIDHNSKKILLNILQFKHIVEKITYDYNVEKLCSYLFDLSQKVSNLPYKSIIKQFHLYLEEKKILNLLEIIEHSKGNKNIRKVAKNEFEGEKMLEKKKKNANCISTMENYDMFLTVIENVGNINKDDMKKNLSNEELEKVKFFVLNIILDVAIMQSYLFIVSKVFKMLNLHLVKFD